MINSHGAITFQSRLAASHCVIYGSLAVVVSLGATGYDQGGEWHNGVNYYQFNPNRRHNHSNTIIRFLFNFRLSASQTRQTMPKTIRPAGQDPKTNKQIETDFSSRDPGTPVKRNRTPSQQACRCAA